MKKVLVVLPVTDRHKVVLEANAKDAEFEYCLVENLTKEIVHSANVIIGNLPHALLEGTKNLEWLQLSFAGTDGYCVEGLLPKQAILTNSTGAYGLAISEYMLGVLLSLQKKLNLYFENQKQHRWKDEGTVFSIDGSTTLVVGMGDIGGEFARKMKALGSYVIGIRRTEGSKPEYADEVYTMEQLDEHLERADIIALSLPNTKATYKVFHAERFKKMKDSAILINVGRGNAIDTEALCNALINKEIYGAALDVTDPEPLPESHRLWDIENVIITPHISGYYHLPETFERIIKIAAENMGHFFGDEKSRMTNIIDFQTGYRKIKSVK